jgi:hypothetical protein
MKPLMTIRNLFAVTTIAGMAMFGASAMAQCGAPARVAPTPYAYRSAYAGGTGTYSYRSYYSGAPSVAPMYRPVTPYRAAAPSFVGTESAYRRSLGKPL